MQRTVVGVLRGGPSSEYEVSLNSGATVLAHLDRTRFEARDIFISRNGLWHLSGKVVPIDKALQGVDVIFNALHGEFGEDGQVQRILETYGIPYTGSDSVASSIAISKHRTKELVAPLGIRMAQGLLISPEDEEQREIDALRVFNAFPAPWVVKPAAAGSSVGVSVARDFTALGEAIAAAQKIGPKVLVEEFVRGKEATVGVADHFRGEETYAFFPVEIIPPGNAMCWSYTAKYDGSSQEICPGNFTPAQKEELADVARKVHKALGLAHYSRSDFIVTPRGAYFLEVNTLPGLTSESLLPKAVKAAGSTLTDFFSHLIDLALKRK